LCALSVVNSSAARSKTRATNKWRCLQADGWHVLYYTARTTVCSSFAQLLLKATVVPTPCATTGACRVQLLVRANAARDNEFTTREYWRDLEWRHVRPGAYSRHYRGFS
jgi:hypothetical protein